MLARLRLPIAVASIVTGAAASAQIQPAKLAGRATSDYEFVFLKPTLRDGATPDSPPLACVEGKLPRGLPVLLVPLDGSAGTVSYTAEHSDPTFGGGPCTVLEGTYNPRSVTFAIVGLKKATVRPAKATETMSPTDRSEAVRRASSALSKGSVRTLCSQGKFEVAPDPVGVSRPFGTELPVFLVTFAGKLPSGLEVISGPVVAVVQGSAEVPWGSLTTPQPIGFFVNDKPFLWSGESGEDCGARNDRIYAVEGARLRLVRESGFLAD